MSEEEILKNLWEKVEKPENISHIKVVNVFDNAYRINIWCEYNDKKDDMKKLKIEKSYFCRVKEKELIIFRS